MNIAQLSEQLKDVPQNRLIDYARNPNSVVPQFLALAEIQRRQHLQAQAQPVPATVAEDVLGQAAPQVSPQVVQMAQQLPENQPGVAQLPTGMPRGMAGGGIVAFADGGDIYDDEEGVYDAEEMQIQKDENRIRSLIASMRSKAGEMAYAVPRAIEAVKASLPQSYERAIAERQATTPAGSTDVKGLISSAAAKHNLPADFLNRVAGIESGGDPNSVNKTGSTAKGLFGFLDSTWKGYGVNPDDRSKPEVQAEYGARLARENAEFLKKKLGRDPSYHEVYAANYFGAKGANSLLRESEDTPIKTALSRFEPKERVELIMKQNPNLKGKTVGDVMGNLRKKMGEGIVTLAQGGIASYAGDKGSVVKSDDEEDYETDYLRRSRGLTSGVRSVYDAFTTPRNYDLYDMYQNYIGKPFASGVNRFVNEPLEEQAAKFRSYSRNPNATVGYKTPVGSNTPVPTSAVATPSPYGPSENERLHARYPAPIVRDSQPTDQEWRDFDQASALFNAEQRLNKPKENTEPSAQSWEKEMLARNLADRQALKEQAQTDAYLALMQAGLGMMAGSSPYALQNIGAGGMQGISSYAAAKKQRAAEAAGLGKEELSIRRLKQLEDSEKAALEQAAELKRAGFSQKEAEAYRKQIENARDDLRMYQEMRVKQIENKYTKNPLWGTDPKLKQAYDLEIANLYNDPQYLALFKLGYPNIDLSPKSSGTTSGSRPPLSSFNK